MLTRNMQHPIILSTRYNYITCKTYDENDDTSYDYQERYAMYDIRDFIEFRFATHKSLKFTPIL